MIRYTKTSGNCNTKPAKLFALRDVDFGALNRSQLAEALGVGRTTIDRWVRAGLPYRQRPADKLDREAPAHRRVWAFSLPDVVRWLMYHAKRRRYTNG